MYIKHDEVFVVGDKVKRSEFFRFYEDDNNRPAEGVVANVEKVPEHLQSGASHAQWILIGDSLYSGALYRKA